MTHKTVNIRWYEDLVDRAFRHYEKALGLTPIKMEFMAYVRSLENQLKEKRAMKVQDQGTQTEDHHNQKDEFKSIEDLVEEKKQKWVKSFSNLKSELESEKTKRLDGENKIKILEREMKTLRTERELYISKGTPKTDTHNVNVPSSSKRPLDKKEGSSKKPRSEETTESKEESPKSTESFNATSVNRPRRHDDSKPRPYKCSQCRNGFTLEKNLKAHVIRVHSKNRPLHCQICAKQFALQSSLNTHVKALHSVNKQVCPVCGKLCTTDLKLRNHMQMHNKKFECVVCQKKFTSVSHLAQHERTHAKKIEEPTILEHTKIILAPAVASELDRLKKFTSSLGQNFSIEITGQIYVKMSGSPQIIQRESYDPNQFQVPALLMYIPYTNEFKREGEDGHFVVTTRSNPFNWIHQQIYNAKNGIKGGDACTHLAQALFEGKRFEYKDYIVVAAADRLSTGLDLKFTANTISAVSNRIEKEPALHTKWKKEDQKVFLRQVVERQVPSK